jgi:surfeit locus 1 family protein
MTLLALAAVVGFAGLGRWQWHRAAQKSALLTQFEAGGHDPIDLAGRRISQLPRYVQVRTEGRYDGQHQFVLDNISHDAQPGFEVLTPLQTTDGRVLMVNRGWVPLGANRSQLPDVRLDESAPLSVTGRLDDLPVVGIALGHVPPAPGPEWPKLTSFPTMSDLSTALGRPLIERQLLLNPSDRFGFVRQWQMAGFGPARHLSYALQWWSFATLALVLYAVLNWRRPAR